MKSVKNVTFKKIFAFIISLIITAQYVGAAQISDNDGGAFITNELSAYLIQFNFSKM